MSKTKKKLTKEERREVRLRKARQWVLTYDGSHIARAYRKRFGVDPVCAMKDLAAIGALSPENLENMRRAEEIRLQKRREEREESERREFCMRYPEHDSNHKRQCVNCGRRMIQQFTGLKHCKCGISWKKDIGYFERSPGMVFALERKAIGGKVKQIPVIRSPEP